MHTYIYPDVRPIELSDSAPDLFTVTRLIATAIGDVFREKTLHIVAESAANIMDNASDRCAVEQSGMPLRFEAFRLWSERRNSAPLNKQLLPFELVFDEASDADGVRRLAYPLTPERRYTDTLAEMTADGKPLFKVHRGLEQEPVTPGVEPRNDRSLRHLPRWVLPSTEEDAFLEVSKSRNIDLNSYIPPERRLRSALRASIDVTSLESAQGLNSRTRNSYLRQATATFLSSPEGQATSRPEPLPESHWASVHELPPVFTPDPEATKAVIDLFNEAVAKQR